MLPPDLGFVYHGHEEAYPKYDNYDVINVDKVSQIPCDYMGAMGVPIMFLDKYCSEQFEILECHEPAISVAVLRNKSGFKEYKSGQLYVNGVLCCVVLEDVSSVVY